MDKDSIWKQTLEMLANSNIASVVFDTMLAKTVPVSFKHGILTVEAESTFFKDTIKKRYLSEITRLVRSLTNEETDVNFVAARDARDNRSNKGVKPENEGYEKTGLKERYTFDTFVPGKCNELAYAASRAISDEPGHADSYNPLFLYGGVGLGKTHLIYSIGNHILEIKPNFRVLYVTGHDFTNEFITSVRERTTPEFRKKYRNVDVLLIDDVQFLAGRKETQEELFHTYNMMYNANKQIVFTSDVPPKELRDLEDRLTSRFASGLIADVTIPDYETRTAILEKMLHIEKLDIPFNVKEFLLRNIVSNIRDMEGALNKIIGSARLTNTTITLELAERVLKDQIVGVKNQEISMEYIRSVVASHFKISIAEITAKKRTRNITLPRQIAMYLIRKLMTGTLPDIGRFFGGFDHTTVIHSCEKIAGEIETDEKLRLLVEELEVRIKGE